MAIELFGITVPILAVAIVIWSFRTSTLRKFAASSLRFRLFQSFSVVFAALGLFGSTLPAFAEILSPPTINGANALATNNIGGTTNSTANNGSLTNLGQLGSYNFSFSSAFFKASGTSPAQWNGGYNFINATTLQLQLRYAYYINNTVNVPTGDAGYVAHTWQFNQAVNGLRFRWQGIDLGDNIEVFAFNGATVVPILASYYTINGGEKTAYSPRVNRFNPASALDTNAVGIQAADPTIAANSGFGVNTSVDFAFPANVTITRLLIRSGKGTISNGNITTQLTNIAWDVETVKVQKISVGGTGTFGFTAAPNLASVPANIATATVDVAAPAVPTSIVVNTLNANLNITEAAVAGYTLTKFACTDANSAVTGNPASFGTFVSSTRIGTIPAANVKTGANITCQFTNTRTAVRVQKISLGGTGTFGFTAQTNLASTPANIITSTAGVAAPATPPIVPSINVTTAGTAVTMTEAAVAGYTLTGFTCSDANAATTLNPASFGTFVSATRVGTIPAANVVTGADITCVFTNSKSPTLTLTKALSSNRVAAGDQFAVALRTGGVAGTVVNVTTNSTTTGATNVVTGGTGTTGTFVATAGTAYTLTEAASGTTNFAQYTSAITCTDSAGLQTGLPSGAAYTVATGLTITPVAGAVISCVLTNTAIAPTIAMIKSMSGNRVANTDQFTVAIRTGGVAGTVVNATGSSTTTGTGSTVTGGTGTTGTFTTTAGTAYTLTEGTSGTTNFAQYTTRLVCSDSAGLQTGLPTGGTPFDTAVGFAVTPVAGAVISCTLINSAKAPTLAMTKALGSNRVVVTDQFTVALRTGGVAGTVVNVTTNSTTTGATNLVTGGTGTTGTFVATAGTAYTLTEAASGTTNFAQYTSAITCTDSAGLQPGLPSAAAYTVASGSTITPVAGAVIGCTLTNTAKAPTLAVTKALGSNRAVASDQFTVAIRTGGGAGTVVNVTTNSTTAGATNVVTAGTGTSGIFTSVAGTAYTLTEVGSGGTNFAQYTSVISCTDSAGLQTGLPSGAAFIAGATGGAGLTLTPVAGAAISCTLTNTAKAPTLTITKISNGGVDAFTFTGDNGWASQTITTSVSGTGVTGATQTLNAVGVATTLTEGAVASFYMTGVTCAGTGGGTQPTVDLVNHTIAFNAAQTAAGSTITCIVSNGVASLTITKALTSGPSPITDAGQTLGYTITVANPSTVNLESVALTDALTQGVTSLTLTSGPTYLSGDSDGDTILDAGETWLYSASYTVAQAVVDDGTSLSNEASVTTDKTAVQTSNAVTTAITQTSTLSILKDKVITKGPGNISANLQAGDTVTYSYDVTNTGNTTQTTIDVADSHNGAVALNDPSHVLLTDSGNIGDSPDSNPSAQIWGTLGVDDVVRFTVTYNITQADVDLLQ